MLFFFFRISIIIIFCLSILSSSFSRRLLPNYGTTLALEVEYACTSSSPGSPKGVFLINQNFPPGTPGDPHVIVIRGTSACNVIISNCQNIAVDFRDPITDATNITIESSTANPNKSPHTIKFTETINNRGGSISIQQFSVPTGVRENFRGSVQSVIYHSSGSIEALDLYQIDNVHYSANFSGVANNPVSQPAIFLFILMFNFHQGVYFRNIKTLRLENNVISILAVNPTYFSGWPVSMRVLHANHSQNSFKSMQLFSVKNNRILVENTPHTLTHELDVIRIDGNIEQVSRIEVANNEILVQSSFDLDTTVGKLASYAIFLVEGGCKKISEGIYFTKNNRISLNRLAGFSGGTFVVRGLMLRGSLSVDDEESVNDEINEIVLDSVSIHVTTSQTRGFSPIIGTVVSDLIQGVLIASLHRIHSQLVISNIVISGNLVHTALEPSPLNNYVLQTRVLNLGGVVIVPHPTRHLLWSSSSSVLSSVSRILIHNVSIQNFKLYSDGLVVAASMIRVVDLPEAFYFDSVTASLIRVHELNITMKNVRYLAQSSMVLLYSLPATIEGGLEVASEFRHLKYLNLTDFIVSGDDVSQTVLSHEDPNRWFAGLTPEVNSYVIFCDIKNSIRDVEHVEISRFRLGSSVQNEQTNSNNNNNNHNGKHFIHVSAPAAQTEEVHVTGVVIYGEQMENIKSFVFQNCILELPSISSSTLNLDITLLSLPNMSGVDEVHVRNNVISFSSSSIIESTKAGVEIVGVRFRDKLIANSGIFFLRNLFMIFGNDDESTTVIIRAANNVHLSGLLMKTQEGDGFREIWLYQNKFLSSARVHSEIGSIDFVWGLRTIHPTLPCRNLAMKNFNINFVKGTLVANSSINLKLLAIGNETTKEETNINNNRNITIENIEVNIYHSHLFAAGPTFINLFDFSSSIKHSLFQIHNVTMSVFDSRFSFQKETYIVFATLHHPHNHRLIVNCSSLKFYVNDNVTGFGNNVTFGLIAMRTRSTITQISDHAFILQNSTIHIESSLVSSVSALQVLLSPVGIITQNNDAVIMSPPVSFASSQDLFLHHVRHNILSPNSPLLMNMSFLFIRNVKIASSAQRTALVDTSTGQLLQVIVVIFNNTLLTTPSTHHDYYSELHLVKGSFVNNLYLEDCLLESSHSKMTFVEICSSSAPPSPQQASPFSLIYFGSGLKFSISSNSNNPMTTEMNLLEFGPNSSSFTSLAASEVVFENFNFSQIISSLLPSSVRLSIIKFNSPRHWHLPLLSSSSYNDHHPLVRFRFQNVHLFSVEQIINSINYVNLIYLMNSAPPLLSSSSKSNFSLLRTEWIWFCNQDRDRDRESAASTLPILARSFNKILSFNGTLYKLRCTQSESISVGTRSSSVSKQISISEQNLSSTKSLSDSDHSKSYSEASSSFSKDKFTDTLHSDTPSSSQHHTSSVSFSHTLPLPPRPRSWQQLFEGSAEIVAVGAALAAGPASFTSMKKVLASRMFLDCPSPKSIPPAEFDSNPLHLSFASRSSATEDAISTYRGAIVGNAILVIALQVIFISFVYISAQRDVKTFAQKAARYQYPGLSSGWICIGSAMQSVPVGVVVASFFAADDNELVDSTIDNGLHMTLLVVFGGGLLLGPVLWMHFVAKKVKSSGEVKLVDVGDEINHDDIEWGDGEGDGFNKHHHHSRRKHRMKMKKESKQNKTYNLDGTVRREYECGDVIDYVFGQPKFWRKRFFRRSLAFENINEIRLKMSTSSTRTRNKNRKHQTDSKKNKQQTNDDVKHDNDIDDDDDNDEFKNSTETTDFLNTHGFMFSAFSNPYFMIVDHVAVIAIGVSSGVTILCESESCCASTLYTATAVAAFHFLFVVFARPFLQRIEDFLLTLISGAVLALLILVIVAQRSSTQNDDGEKELSPSLENTVNILTMTTIALSFVHLVSIIIDESRSFILRMISRCKKRLRKNQKHHPQGSEYLTMEELMGTKTENNGNEEVNLDDVLLPETTTSTINYKKQRHADDDDDDDKDDDEQQKMEDFFAPDANATKSKKPRTTTKITILKTKRKKKKSDVGEDTDEKPLARRAEAIQDLIL